jgi:putative membrane protein
VRRSYSGRVTETDREVVDATRRTRLANERTFLAWLRTAMTAMAVAIGAGRIVPGVANVERWPFAFFGAGFAVLAVLLIAFGTRRFVQVEQGLRGAESAALPVANVLVLAAIVLVLSLATLVLVFVR